MSKDNQEKIPDYIGHRARMKDKVLTKGANSLTETELLEFLLMYSIPRKDVKPIAKDLLRRFLSLRNVLSASPALLEQTRGVKESTICLFKAVEASCFQMLGPSTEKETYLEDWDSILDYARMHLSHLDTEILLIIYLDSKKRVLKVEPVDQGARGEIQIVPSKIVTDCIAAKASFIILIHNHPSGKILPSQDDLESTRILSEKLASLDITLVDHLIVSKNKVYSINSRSVIS